jgi:hypothetical protein
VNLNAKLFAPVLVIGALIGILKASPPADVVNQNGFESRARAGYVEEELSQGRSMSKVDAALCLIRICSNEFISM